MARSSYRIEERQVMTESSGPGAETVVVRRSVLQLLLDAIVNSDLFELATWSDTDLTNTLVAREAAEVLGMCPMAATPKEHRLHFPICAGLQAGIEKLKLQLPPDFMAQQVANYTRDDYLLLYAIHEDHL